MTVNYFAANTFASDHFASDQLAGGASVPADGCYFGSYEFQANYFGNYYFCGNGTPVPPTPPASSALGGAGGGGWNCFPEPWYDGKSSCEIQTQEAAQILERFNAWRSSRGTKARRKTGRRKVKARMLSGTRKIFRPVEKEAAPPQVVVVRQQMGIGGMVVAVAIGVLLGYLIAKSLPSRRSGRRRR